MLISHVIVIVSVEANLSFVLEVQEGYKLESG